MPADAPAPETRVETTPGRSVAWMVTRFAALVAILAAGFLLVRFTPLAEYLDRDRLELLLGEVRSVWWAPLAFVGVYAVACPLGIPVSPLILAGGVVFGLWPGGLYNLVGNLLGAATTFHLGHLLGRDLVVHLAGKRLVRVERMLARHGFWSLVAIRFVPVPFPVVNYGAALAGVPASTFLASAVVGLTPAILAITWFAAALTAAAEGERGAVFLQLGAAFAVFFALSTVPRLLRGRRRKRRLETLRRERSAK